MPDFQLAVASSGEWVEAVLANFDAFLLDHAANERKASAMAMSLVAHYPDKAELVNAMIDLALEELGHFRQVVRLATARGLQLAPDEKDPYVNRIREQVRQGSDHYFLDRLLSASVIEFRGAERFRTLSRHLTDDSLRRFYASLASSEQGHHLLFLELATRYFPKPMVYSRMEAWLAIEQDIVAGIPARPRLH